SPGPRRAGNRTGARIPFEFVGRARDLRRRLHNSASAAVAEGDKLLQPLRPAPGKTPMPSHRYLRQFARRWRALPAFGRLRLQIEFAKGRLTIIELRCIPTVIALPGWVQDEPALALGLQIIIAEPPSFTENRRILATLGLHGLPGAIKEAPGTPTKPSL